MRRRFRWRSNKLIWSIKQPGQEKWDTRGNKSIERTTVKEPLTWNWQCDLSADYFRLLRLILLFYFLASPVHIYLPISPSPLETFSQESCWGTKYRRMSPAFTLGHPPISTLYMQATGLLFRWPTTMNGNLLWAKQEHEDIYGGSFSGCRKRRRGRSRNIVADA